MRMRTSSLNNEVPDMVRGLYYDFDSEFPTDPFPPPLLA